MNDEELKIKDLPLETIESNKFTVLNEQGNPVECEALFTFESEDTGKNYIVYTDNTLDEEGNTKIYASIFDIEDPTSLKPVETDEEWNMIESLLEQLSEDQPE